MPLAIYWNVFLPFNPMIVWEQISKYHPPGCEKFSVRSQRCDQSDVPQNFSGTEPSYHHTIIIITIIVIIINIINILVVIIFIIIKIKQMICRTSLAPTTQSQHHPLCLTSQLRFASLGWLIISDISYNRFPEDYFTIFIIFSYLMWRCGTFSCTTVATEIRTIYKLANTFHLFDQKHKEHAKCCTLCWSCSWWRWSGGYLTNL